MSKLTITFTVSLADIPIRITCRYRENMDFLKDYLTDRDPLLFIEPTQDDLNRIKQGFEQRAKQDSRQEQWYDESFLENNAIHALIAEGFVAHNVLLFHGSALSMDGQAYIFTASSGTGKSTHARLWREAFGERVWIINDDKPLIRLEAGRAMVYGSPWDGKHRLSRNAAAPLKAIVSLKRSRTNRIRPMAKAEAFPVLIRQAFRSENPIVMAQILNLEKQLLEMADFYHLDCNTNPEAAKAAWEGIVNTRSE